MAAPSNKQIKPTTQAHLKDMVNRFGHEYVAQRLKLIDWRRGHPSTPKQREAAFARIDRMLKGTAKISNEERLAISRMYNNTTEKFRREILRRIGEFVRRGYDEYNRAPNPSDMIHWLDEFITKKTKMDENRRKGISPTKEDFQELAIYQHGFGIRFRSIKWPHS